jgi:hypothetical protein
MNFRLQILILGLAILTGMGAHWWWLEHKTNKSQNLDDSESPLGGVKERIDPLSSDLPINETMAPVADDLPTLPTVTLDRRPVLNPLIDCIAMLDMDESCSGEFALSLLPTTRRIGSKTWLVEGFNRGTEAWEPVIAGETYNYFQAGIQRVNRHGALNDVEFSEFVAKASQLAEGLGASPDFPEMLSEVARARALEQFTTAHDIRLSLNLHAKRAAWSLPYLQQHAHKAGFVAGAIPGRWVLGDGRHEMLALTIDAHLAMDDDVDLVPIRKLALTLEVPQVVRCDQNMHKPFDVMSDIAIRLCAGMEALLLDEGGLAVDLQALQRTANELEAVYDQLDAFGAPAGSALAKRLFS